MITTRRLDEVLAYKPGTGYVLSLYVNTHLGEGNLEKQRIAAKNLIQSGMETIREQPMSAAERRRVQQDLERIEEYLQEMQLSSHSHRGLAVFAGPDLWQIFELPQPVRSSLYLDRTPYIRPLMAILSAYHRILVTLVDRRQAIFYEYYMGQLHEIRRLDEDVPGRVRIAGWAGYEERRVQRHIHDHEHRHYKNVADWLFRWFKAGHFEYLILGCHEAELKKFQNHLHPWINERVIGWFAAEPDVKLTPLRRIRQEVERLESDFRRKEQERLVQEVIDKSQSQGTAVLGLKDTLIALGQGALHTLLVEEGWATPGWQCHDCGYITEEAGDCPYCQTEMAQVPDLVDEIVTSAIDAGVPVHHVSDNTALAQAGHIGGLLRFRPHNLQSAA